MNNIKKTLETLIAYYGSTRGVGHTSAALGIKTDNKPLYVTYRNNPIIDGTAKTPLLYGNLEQNLIGRKQPLLIDHHVLNEIFP